MTSKMQYESKFDNMLFDILNRVGDVEMFLDILFSFLYRRTDFFMVKQAASQKIGFPPGEAEKIMNRAFQKYLLLGKRKEMSRTTSEASGAKEGVMKTSKEKPPEKSKAKDMPANPHFTPQSTDLSKEDSTSKSEKKPVKDVSEAKEEKAADDEGEKSPKSGSENKERVEKTTDEDESERRYYDSSPECYNGASYDHYSWAQNIYDLDVQVKVPSGVTSGDQVKVLIEQNHLKVEVLQDEEWQVLLDGVLCYDEVRRNDSTWTLHPSDHIHIQLEKTYERYWEALLEGEPKLDVRNIDCSRPYEDLEPEAQAKLQEMMFDQHQKMLGKPTSQQIKVQEMLKQLWIREDSPFKGQEFDPSLLNLK